MDPNPTDSAEDPCQPSRIAPQSIEITSPARSTWFLLGMPCTTCSLTEVQIDAGYPKYPRNEGTAPAARISRSAIESSSAVVMPGATDSLSTVSVRATTCPAAYMRPICSGDLT